jgi:hypothetical protein
MREKIDFRLEVAVDQWRSHYLTWEQFEDRLSEIKEQDSAVSEAEDIIKRYGGNR